MGGETMKGKPLLEEGVLFLRGWEIMLAGF